jgi:glyoxylase-like metal-dependent hydrolase (beta-lactamase superfamily II)
MNDAARPLVAEGTTEQVHERVHVIPDARVEFVPNVGIVVGDDAVLVIDTAMGAENGERILREARRIGGDRKLFLTTTHFHPEHAFGASAFRSDATYVANAAQAEELAAKGAEYVEMFTGFGPALAELLADVELVPPELTYSGERAALDLGGVTVQLLYLGPAHTRGDQLVFLPGERILFAGDLVENRFLPIFPDPDADGVLWLEMLDRLDALEPDIVIPGHGATGDLALVDDLRTYLVAVRDRVAELRSGGQAPDAIEATVDEEMRNRYADWDNQMWIPSAVQSFHSRPAG